jgi:hypothetical protein
MSTCDYCGIEYELFRNFDEGTLTFGYIQRHLCPRCATSIYEKSNNYCSLTAAEKER